MPACSPMKASMYAEVGQDFSRVVLFPPLLLRQDLTILATVHKVSIRFSCFQLQTYSRTACWVSRHLMWLFECALGTLQSGPLPNVTRESSFRSQVLKQGALRPGSVFCFRTPRVGKSSDSPSWRCEVLPVMSEQSKNPLAIFSSQHVGCVTGWEPCYPGSKPASPFLLSTQLCASDTCLPPAPCCKAKVLLCVFY